MTDNPSIHCCTHMYAHLKMRGHDAQHIFTHDFAVEKWRLMKINEAAEFFFCATIPDRREDLYNTGAQIDRYFMDNLNTTIRRESVPSQAMQISNGTTVYSISTLSLPSSHSSKYEFSHIVASRYNSKIITSAPHTQRHIKAEIPHLGQMDAKGWTERDRGVSPLPSSSSLSVFSPVFTASFFSISLSALLPFSLLRLVHWILNKPRLRSWAPARVQC